MNKCDKYKIRKIGYNTRNVNIILCFTKGIFHKNTTSK